jgi:hypothetical protein
MLFFFLKKKNSAPEQYDVIDAIINPIQRKNLAEVLN